MRFVHTSHKMVGWDDIEYAYIRDVVHVQIPVIPPLPTLASLTKANPVWCSQSA